MESLKNWDDLIHGTAVFGALVPFLLVLALALKAPVRIWWALVALGLVPVTYWLFPLPKWPPKGSEHIVGISLIAATAILSLESLLARWAKWPLRLLLRAAVFVVIGLNIYPAWLATEEYVQHKRLICAGFGVTIAIWSVLVEVVVKRGGARRLALTPAALLPPTIALAVLSGIGGSIQSAQVVGALAAGIAAICLMVLLRRGAATDGQLGGVGALWGIFFLLIGWCGWLFAEIRYGLACLLLCAPLAAALLSLIPLLPRQNRFLCQLWDFVGAALVSVPVAAVAASQYAEEMAEFEGY